MSDRVIIKRCVICGQFKVHDGCVICNGCTVGLCVKEWGLKWND